MIGHRRERAAGFILQELTLMLRNALRDPRVQPLTITDVDLTPDRRVARVYVACYAGEDELAEGLKGLESAKSFLRSRLAQLLHWPFTPELEFRVDRSWERGAQIDALLNRLGQEAQEQPDDDEQPE
jgi:ribosome-binding factor A